MEASRPQSDATREIYKHAETQYVSSGTKKTDSDNLLHNVFGTITFFKPQYVLRLEKHFCIDQMIESDSGYTEMEELWSAHCADKKGEVQPPLYRWIHIPANNRQWLEQALHQILDFYYPGDRKQDWLKQRKNQILHADNWSGQQNRSPTRMYSRYMSPFGKQLGNDGKTGGPAKSLPKEQTTVALYFPFLHWERSIAANYMNHVARNVGSKQYRSKSQGLCLENFVGPHGPTDEYLLRKYLRSESPIHMRRTLDQFYHVDLESTRDRDIDQTISRHFEKNFATEGRKLGQLTNREPPILMVDQCWFWMLGTDTILTSWPSTWASFDGLSDPLDVRERIMETLQKPSRRGRAKSACVWAQFILEQCLGNIIEYSGTTCKAVNKPEGRWKFLDQYALSLN